MTLSPMFRTPWPEEREGRRVIPFDQSFEFVLDGKSEPIRKNVAVSVEGGFTATAIGYGFVAEAPSVEFGPTSSVLLALTTPPTLDQITLGDILNGAQRALGGRADFGRERPVRDIVARTGIQLNPEFADIALRSTNLSGRVLSRMFRIAGNTDGEVLFRYALSDEGSGRSFQSEPVLNIAGLGTSNGERPFRHFAPPIEFGPRSVIGLEITPVSSHIGKLFVSLQGFKVLGGAGTPTSTSAQFRKRGRRR